MSDSSSSVFLHLLFIYLFVLHGVTQAAQTEWQTLAASARPHDRVWLKQKLQQVDRRTLYQYVKDAGVPFVKNPKKEWCVAALLDKEFPVAPRFCRKWSLWVYSFFPLNVIWCQKQWKPTCFFCVYVFVRGRLAASSYGQRLWQRVWKHGEPYDQDCLVLRSWSCSGWQRRSAFQQWTKPWHSCEPFGRQPHARGNSGRSDSLPNLEVTVCVLWPRAGFWSWVWDCEFFPKSFFTSWTLGIFTWCELTRCGTFERIRRHLHRGCANTSVCRSTARGFSYAMSTGRCTAVCARSVREAASDSVSMRAPWTARLHYGLRFSWSKLWRKESRRVFPTTKLLFFFSSKFASFGYLISIVFIGRGCRLVESASDDFGGRSLLCWSSSGGCCHFADTRARNASEKLGWSICSRRSS